MNWLKESDYLWNMTGQKTWLNSGQHEMLPAETPCGCTFWLVTEKI